MRAVTLRFHRRNPVAHLDSAQHPTKDRVAEVFGRIAVMIEFDAVIRDINEELRGRAAERLAYAPWPACP